MPDSAGRKTSAERESPAAGKDSEALKQRKERTRRRIRLMHRGRFFFLIDGRETAVNLRLLIGFEVAGRTLGVRNPSTSGEGERKFTESSLVYIIPDFPAGANFCRIFFAAAGGLALPAAFPEFLQKK